VDCNLRGKIPALKTNKKQIPKPSHHKESGKKSDKTVTPTYVYHKKKVGFIAMFYSAMYSIFLYRFGSKSSNIKLISKE
jgi:hypothetical protein